MLFIGPSFEPFILRYEGRSQCQMQVSQPFEEVNVGEFLHLVHVPLRPDDFFIVEEDPGFVAALVGRDRFADEGYVVSVDH